MGGRPHCEAVSEGVVQGDSSTSVLGISAETEAAELPFSDREDIPERAKEAVGAAVKSGIVKGYGDGTFRSMQIVNRAEMTAMIARAMKWGTDAAGQTSFADNAAIPAWARGSIQSAAHQGILEGREGNRFIPDGKATRAEATVALLRLWKLNPVSGDKS